MKPNREVTDSDGVSHSDKRWTIAKRQWQEQRQRQRHRVFAEAAENMPELLKRDFTAARPWRKFVGDIGEKIGRDLPMRSSKRRTVVCRN